MAKWNPGLDLPSLKDDEKVQVVILSSRIRYDMDFDIEINEESKSRISPLK